VVSRSVLVRLIASSIVVATCAIVATAWLTTRSTTNQLRGELKRTLDADNKIYDTLVNYGGTNASWEGVQTELASMSKATGRTITLASQDGNVIASSDPAAPRKMPSDAVAAALVDPVAPSTTPSGIKSDPVKGTLTLPSAAYALEPDEVVSRSKLIAKSLECATSVGLQARVVDGPYGATVVEIDGVDKRDLKVNALCDEPDLQVPGRRYIAINNAIIDATTPCLDAHGIAYGVSTDPGTGMRLLKSASVSSTDVDAEDNCLGDAQRVAMTPYVAPSALLYLTTSSTSPGWLANAGGPRIVFALLAVLAITLAGAALEGQRLLRPIRSLTGAAQRMAAGDLGARVAVSGADEIARLGSAFNAMADSVETSEQQRKMLVSDVAHELRNPLANVRGYLEAAQDSVVRFDDTLIDSLLEETLLLQHLIDDLQDLALADAGRLRIHPEPADAVALAEHVVSAHRALADHAGVTLDLSGDVYIAVNVDQVRIRQVLGNLVANAIRYTPQGGRVSVVVRADPLRSALMIEVTDTGSGVSEDDLPHLFDRFYRADMSRTRATGGSGLGLSIARHLVEAHGGSINVASCLGTGSHFSIELPMDEPLVSAGR
jgi:two-component system sensor histidine kinase BaeS